MFRKLRLRRPVVALASVAVAITGLSAGLGAAPAQADPLPAHLQKFANCPVLNDAVTVCYVMETSSVSIKAGKFDEATSTDPMILQFGGIADTYTQTTISVPPANGISALQAPPIELPGGILGLPGFEFWPLEAYITPQIVGLPQLNLDNLMTNDPVMNLNLKAKISNPFTDVLTMLGDKCTIGSDASPIKLNLTAGTTDPPPPNQPVTGDPGTIDYDYQGTGVIRISGQTVVDNSWGLPKASNCGLTGALNGVIDIADDQANSGPGKNSATMDTTIWSVSANTVRTAMGLPTTRPPRPGRIQEALSDGDFADAGMGPWECAGQCGVDHGLGNARTGPDNGWVRNNNNKWNDLHQKTILARNSNYTLSGWIRTSSNNADGYFGVRTLDGTVIAEQKFGHFAGYTKVTVTFNSGNHTGVEVFGGLWPHGDTWAQFDDLSLINS
ncbi:hypothetical protein KVF89_04480 [Nocardioides carbamazepini]|uniref:hypothetical protein n=1 Tax=Nocardioides carbamazepini TaxID=2854259 RepID=UPI00214A1E6C|nr:hypothetical protein [Nocardioides carbamazepini]MCR1781784.1 hypothetical protein [Nocardioides carbamazepini]